MKTSRCVCGQTLFAHNIQCLACGSMVGHCGNCHSVKTAISESSDSTTCEAGLTEGGQRMVCSECKDDLVPCVNRQKISCNNWISATEASNSLESQCKFCQLTTVLPDLSISGNLEKWTLLEREKRRLLVQASRLSTPPFVNGSLTDGIPFPLTFQFLADVVNADQTVTRAYTGHCQGVITINIEEADSVYREKVRLELGEPQRTIIGHLRHEYGHYLDFSLPNDKRLEYISLFGDPNAVDYEQAKEKYYNEGPMSNWRDHYVSAYASMHPLEDFAETANLYFDIAALIETITDQQIVEGGRWLVKENGSGFAAVLSAALRVALVVSELNQDMGLPPLLPENLPPAVTSKLSFFHSLTNGTIGLH